MDGVYPLVFEPMFFEKVWGGRALERFGKRLPPGKSIGESWEVADLASTSVSGAGGGAARSIVSNGALRGRTLHEVIGLWGEALISRSGLTDEGGFPLLIKYLDARENLSVQVHPSPAYAAGRPGAHLKTESWYILDAEPGALLYKGVKRGVTRESFARKVADGNVVEDLIEVAAVPGTVHDLPSGTVHALGAGVVVAEVQTPSDTTFRVFDWGRAGRELHIGPALECIDFGPAPRGRRIVGGGGSARARLSETAFYTIDEISLSCEERAIGGGADQRAGGTGGSCVVLMVISGTGSVSPRAGGESGFEEVMVRAGTTVLVPAAIAPAAALRMGPGGRVLCVGLAGR
ncbi:MAG: class I mannose-6-phosphate isomerase [Phycisphaerae bacterium]|nr:class I mannose-6-phosphate isomerase [Phycisphaerae bacterium]